MESDQPDRSPRPDDAARPPSGTSGSRRLEQPEDFRRTVLFTILGTLVPGVGLIAARRRILGGAILAVFLAGLLTLGIWALVDIHSLAGAVVRPQVLHVLTVALIVLAVLWVGIVVVTHLALRRRPSRRQRVGGGILVALLAFLVAAPMAVAARYSYDTADAFSSVFQSEKNTKSATRPTLQDPNRKGAAPDVWANKPRLNILLLGGDADRGRAGTRTDTVILASIDTRTGDTTLFSLPRNTARMPFPANSPLRRYYPRGFTNGNGADPEYFLNAMYRNVPARVPNNILGETDNLGADALKLSVGTALGLPVDYYVLINLHGFEKLVDALGGITVNINSYIPIGGNTDLHIPPKEYLKPGPNQKLDGRSALWYARGRYGSDDYARMDRQRCVINAIIEQANPANVLARYEGIVRAGKKIVKTDLPQEVLPLIVDLSLRVKDGNVRSIVFKTGSDGFVSANPNFPQMRERVQVALSETKSAAPKATPTPSPSPTVGATPGAGGSTPSVTPSPSPKKKKAKPTESEDVSDSCAYNPKQAANAQPPR